MRKAYVAAAVVLVILPSIIEGLRRDGYRFVTISKLLAVGQ